MTTLSIKMPETLKARLEQEARLTGNSVSHVVREALEKRLSKPAGKSLLEIAGELAGRGDSGLHDLATNPRHMEGFGQ